MKGLQQKARSAVTMAKKSGALKPEPCRVCGSTEKVEAHHEDYSKPLVVDWLCFVHHRARHKEIGRKSPQMPDLRVNEIDSDLMFDLKILALDEQKTLRQLVIDILTQYCNDNARGRKPARRK